MKILNLYAGLGGNRKHWTGDITAVERDPKIAAIYAGLYPQDEVIVADAHDFLLRRHEEYGFCWSSPPCQTHSKLSKVTRHNLVGYPDLSLYEEIMFLREHFEGKWVVENVKPYYEPLIPPTNVIGRHLFWSNFFFLAEDVQRPANFINMGTVAETQKLKDWLGIQYEGNLYYGDNHCPGQVLRNCVHPEIGRQIFDQADG